MAKYTPIPAAPGMFRSALAPAAAVCLGIGALLGLGSVLYLPDSGYLTAVSDKILVSGIRTASAHRTWLLIHILISVVSCLCPAFVTWGMASVFRGQAARGMNLLSNGAGRLRLGLRILGWGLIGLFCLRFTVYFLSILRRQDWPYQLLATVLMEALMLSLAVFAYRMLCRFLEEAEGCTASIGYTLSSGFLSPGSVPAFVASGLTVLGIIGLVLTADRLVTMTIGYDGYKQFYKFVWSTHPGQWLCAGSLFFGAVGDLLLSFYLRFYKRTSERAIFYATYKK